MIEYIFWCFWIRKSCDYICGIWKCKVLSQIKKKELFLVDLDMMGVSLTSRWVSTRKV